MDAANRFLVVMALLSLPAYSQAGRQTTLGVRVEAECGITAVQHAILDDQPGLVSGVTRFRVLLRTGAGDGSAILSAAFGPAGTRDSIVSYRITLAGMGGGTVQGEAKAGATHELAVFPAGTRSTRAGMIGEIVWSDHAARNSEVLAALRPSLTISCR